MAKPYNLKVEVKKADGSISPFELAVSRPEQSDTGDYLCLVDCPFVFRDRKRIYGATAEQAMASALWLIENQLQHRECALIDKDGTTITLPIDRNAGIPGSTDGRDTSK